MKALVGKVINTYRTIIPRKKSKINSDNQDIDVSSSAYKITLVYLLFGVLWILLSDKVILALTDSIQLFTLAQMIKGWFYVIVTAFILFTMIRRNNTAFDTSNKKLKESYEELEATYEELIAAEEELREKLGALNKSEQNLKLIEERYRLAVEGSNDGIWDWDVESGAFIFERSKVMLGYGINELHNLRQEWYKLVHPEDIENLEYQLQCFFDQKTQYYRSEYRVRAKDGSYRWILSRGQSIRDANGSVIRMAGSHTDITENKLGEEKIRRAAYYDSITGLRNRYCFMEQLQIELDHAKVKEESVGILLLDLDNFKKTIDTLGHSYGDLLLKRVAELLQGCIGSNSSLYRFGGDEFIVLSRNISNVKNAIREAGNVLNCFKSGLIIQDYESFVTVSIGIALSPQHGAEVETLLKNAEVAMYEAKERGKNCYHLFNDSLQINLLEKTKLENDLRYAIEKEELILHYQPKIDLFTHRVVGGEALIRWLHPTKGMIPPIEFITIAEENGMIGALGEWVLKEVCKQNKIWQDKGYTPMPIAVNISARQFQQKDLVKSIKRILSDTQLEGKWLEIEVTETIAMQDLKYTIRILNELRKMGIAISLDDFGTGYSSLNYLKHLPIDTVKIDKSFVHDICKDSSAAVIADAIVTMAHGMELTVTAEGIETEEQLNQLKKKSCDYAQGYLFYKPIPPNEFEVIIKQN